MDAMVSEYNRDQLASFRAIQVACGQLSEETIQELVLGLQSYLAFRRDLEVFQKHYFDKICKQSCYHTKLSACCGFESIFTFFADHLINYLLSRDEERERFVQVLAQPNRSQRCVYLGPEGCNWKLRPICCAMFYCVQAKDQVFNQNPQLCALWEELGKREKLFTFPTQHVLFDDLERRFLLLNVQSPHMYFHRSPGLLRLKARAGILDESLTALLKGDGEKGSCSTRS